MKLNTAASKSRLIQSLATVAGTLAATVASSQAATVQITLTGNKISTTTNTLNADLTNDGTNDITISGIIQLSTGDNPGVRIKINGGMLMAGYVTSDSDPAYDLAAKFAASGDGVDFVNNAGSVQNIKYLNTISFTDASINGGASTQGYLEVNAFNSSKTDHTIALTRLVFEDASLTLGTAGLSTSATYTEFVPEPSSFAMLALGAGGLLARRRRPAA